jgi:hypothetical protein
MIIAGNPKIFGQLLQVIAPHLTPALRASGPGAGNDDRS